MIEKSETALNLSSGAINNHNNNIETYSIGDSEDHHHQNVHHFNNGNSNHVNHLLLSSANETSSSSSSSSSSSDSTSMKSTMSSRNGQYARVNRIVLDKNSDEYKKRRERNNMAVKKSRTKSKMRTQQTMERVAELKEENEKLETKVKLLTKELSFLKDLFLAHAGSAHNGQLDLNLYNGSHELVGSGGSNNVPINSNVITSTGLNSTSIDCNNPDEKIGVSKSK